jgi:hypothetical protein
MYVAKINNTQLKLGDQSPHVLIFTIILSFSKEILGLYLELNHDPFQRYFSNTF